MRLNSVLKAFSLLLESEEEHAGRFRESWPEAAPGKSSEVMALGLSRLDGRDRSRNGGREASKSA